MESIKKIGYILIALVYLFLSTGIVLVKTNCLCSDITNISINKISDTEDEIHAHQNCCTSENIKDHEHPLCGCDIPEIAFLNLTHQPGSNIKLEYPVWKTFSIVNIFHEISHPIKNDSAEIEIIPAYPPPEKPSGRILISLLNQRKIALTA